MGEREILLIWAKLSGNRWCRLLELDFGLIREHGVYVIWHGGFPSRVVQVGHGDIAAELQSCARDPRVVGYLSEGPLFVTWAAVDASGAAGVHRYLEERFHPLVANRVDPGVAPVAALAPF